MPIAKHIAIGLLVFSLLSSSLPFHHVGDVDSNRRIDLRDAVLLAKGFAESAEEPRLFAERLSEIIAALNSVSGVKTAICHDQAQANTGSGGLRALYLPSTLVTPQTAHNYLILQDKQDPYASISSPVDTPPPRSV